MRGYALMVGVLLGLMQTGLFFQLTFTLSSGFGTYLLVTICWLVGSVVGVGVLSRWPFVTMTGTLCAALGAYGCVALLLERFPFESGLWMVYGGFVLVCGVYPGVFFGRMSQYLAARVLFFHENNGFLLGLAGGTVLYMVAGRVVLWLAPFALGVVLVVLWRQRQKAALLPPVASSAG